MAKHRRAKSNAPVDYDILLAGSTVIAGAFVLVRWFIRRAE
jgi:hypothetical protein